MKVKNRKAVRRLSVKSFKAAGRRNITAAVAIAMTTVLFTALFTIMMSINTSYESYTFRQIGGYAHGTFKDVTSQQASMIESNSKVKAVGRRITAGIITDGGFAKIPAEISYMDDNNAKWSYINLSKGHMPEAEDEIIMDTAALDALGVDPEIGAKIKLTYDMLDVDSTVGSRTDTFRLVGWWDYDDISPVHFINVSEAYVRKVEQAAFGGGADHLREDINVMFRTSIGIEENMKTVENDLGFQSDDLDKDGYVRYGVNWGYTASQAADGIDLEMVAAAAALLILIIMTGYLIIYNIFRISVSSDIRYYGLLKTVGVTPRQLRRIVRQQAMMLCAKGCPAGLVIGYLAGRVLMPVIMESTSLGTSCVEVSISPVIFAASALFSIVTVFLSCARPARMASKVSPVEAVKYADASHGQHKIGKMRRIRKPGAMKSAGLGWMALANLGRNRLKTLVVILSMALSVVLLSVLCAFVGGFDMEKYLSKQTCADFIVGKTDYFNFQAHGTESGLSEGEIAEIKAGTESSVSGMAWSLDDTDSVIWLPKSAGSPDDDALDDDEQTSYAKQALQKEGRENMPCSDLQIEGLDAELLQKLQVIDGELAPMSDSGENAIAVAAETDDNGNLMDGDSLPKPGDTVTVTYIDEGYFIDSRTGEKSSENTPGEYIKYKVARSHDVRYTVCAVVCVPYSMSFRYSDFSSIDAVINSERLRADSDAEIFPMFYMFDAPDRSAEDGDEAFLKELTSSPASSLMYESKATVRAEFEGFRNMFTLLGGVLCVITGLVGILNFFNSIMTGMMSRRYEFAVLQSIGMTGKQLRSMLIYEGLLYAAYAILLSIVLSIIIEPIAGRMLENMFWFYSYRFTLKGIFITAPVFLAAGAVLPALLYRGISRRSIIERLRVGV
ncbi:MAG: FtsX-like permease family protein [Clostridia bacterium]